VRDLNDPELVREFHADPDPEHSEGLRRLLT
jgi:hypothetical protein